MGHAHSFLSAGLQLETGRSYSVSTLNAETRDHMKVLRLSNDESFSLLNGEGQIFDAKMEGKDSFQVRGVEKKEAPRINVELYLSFPKKDSLWEVVSQATELGVSRIVPVASQHNQNPAGARPKLSEKAQRIADEACCQCRQPYRVEVSDEWLSLEEASKKTDATLVFADEASAAESLRPGILSPLTAPAAGTFRLFIGPEGGWSEAERALLKARALRMSLGPNVLRVSTATAVAIYHLRYFTP